MQTGDLKNINELRTRVVNDIIKIFKYEEKLANAERWSADLVSDNWHTFEELYYHRMILFLVIQKCFPDRSWKAKKHSDGTMFDDSFIVGIETPKGDYTYHYDLEYWDMFEDIEEREYAPEYDGHMPEDILRLLSLFYN